MKNPFINWFNTTRNASTVSGEKTFSDQRSIRPDPGIWQKLHKTPGVLREQTQMKMI
ncbi:MAG: hypothetical protein HUU10_14270 [Bacteroidetes bacterium]|nr:hypothetical protein [Bacteroidota bacterium]